jgi:catechol 2,3-dioxygenase
VTTDDPTLPDDPRLGRTALHVADLDDVAEFYRDVVGLEVLARNGDAATHGAGGTALLELEATPEAGDRHRSAAGLFHDAFRVPDRAALGDALKRVRERWRLDGASDHGVSEALYLSDPEGNGVEIYRDRPREQWPIGDDSRVAMITEPLDLEAVAAAGASTSSPPPSAAPPGTDLRHGHLEVTSLSAFEGFYVEGVGFEPQATMSSARFVGAGGYHHHVGANVSNGRSAPAAGHGLAWFEVVLPREIGDDMAAVGWPRTRVVRGRPPGEAALESVRSRLADRDAPVSVTDEGFEATDPDGIRVRFRAAD